jgi:hypothetical protein
LPKFLTAVMAGLVPAIHAAKLLPRIRKKLRMRGFSSCEAVLAGVDGRDKPGHDESALVAVGINHRLDRDRRERRRLEPQRPPHFAVDLLEAKIPIEMGCQGHAFRRAASGGRDP